MTENYQKRRIEYGNTSSTDFSSCNCSVCIIYNCYFQEKPKAKLIISSIVCLVLAMILIPSKDKEEKSKVKETTQQASTEVKEEPKKRRSEKGRTKKRTT